MSPQPREPERRMPAITTEVARPTRRVRIGFNDLLEQLNDDVMTRAAARPEGLTEEHSKRIERVSRLARQLRRELRELAELEPGRGDLS